MVTKTAAAVSTNSVNLTNNAEAVAALKVFAEAKARIKAAEEAKKAAEAIIRAAAGDAQTIIVRGIKAATISDPRTRRSNDAKILQEAFPEAYQASLKETTYDVLNVL